MTFGDLVELSIGNLWRTRLRALLTTFGVVIAIATFVAMLSFGAGNQEHITEAYQEFGLFTSMSVYPQDPPDDTVSAQPAPLDREAIQQLAEIPGVLVAFPYVTLDVTASVLDTHFVCKARALPDEAWQTKLFSEILAGNAFSSDAADETIISRSLMDRLGIDNPDSLIGEPMTVSVNALSLDSALINVIDDGRQTIWRRLKQIDFDSLFYQPYRSRIMRQELNEGLRRFVTGLNDRQLTIADTLTIRGVGEDLSTYNIDIAPLVIPEKTARRLSAGRFALSSDPLSLYDAARRGALFTPDEAESTMTYPQVTLELDPYAQHGPIKDSIEALGFRARSYAEDFKEIQKFFLYFNLGLAVVGLLALVTASLGIINTLLMSVLERRREIGVIKALGAEERDIRILFLVESGVIGAVGSTLGIICGWLAGDPGGFFRDEDHPRTGGCGHVRSLRAPGMADRVVARLWNRGQYAGRILSGGAGRPRGPGGGLARRVSENPL